MHDDARRAPRIDITDPNRPGGPVDVLSSGADRDPWRPGRRTWLGLLAAVLAAIVAASVMLVLQQRAEDRAKDREALRQVMLATTISELADLSRQTETVLIGVRNDGTQVLHLLSYRVLAPGYAEVAGDLTVAPHDVQRLDVPDTATCSPRLLTDTPTLLRVRVRTSRRQVVSRDVSLTLGPGAQDLGPGAALAEAAQERCHYLPTSLAFSGTASDPRLVGDTLVVTLEVGNRGNAPLVLRRLQVSLGLGLTVSPELPLTLRPQPRGFVASQALRLTLRVTSCQDAWADLEAHANGTRSPQDRVTGAFPGAIRATLTGATGNDSADVGLVDDPAAFLNQVCRSGPG